MRLKGVRVRTVNVVIHATQFPEKVARDLSDSLRTRQLNHKFLYDSHKQSRKWLAVHRSYSPWATDHSIAETYESSFVAAVRRIPAPSIHLIGLGCGTGHKEARLLQLLKDAGKKVFFTPVDVSPPLIVSAYQAAAAVIGNARSSGNHPMDGLICDLAAADDLHLWFEQQTPPHTLRLLTFLGMIPNFEPPIILPRLRALARPQDWLLFSANLSPGADYEAGVQRILPQYNNALTGDWLLTFLSDLGVERQDGQIEWSVERPSHRDDLLRITAHFRFKRSCVLHVGEETFEFHANETIRLFFSYRYTSARVRKLLEEYSFALEDQWVTDEEGLYLCSASQS
jgi:uncharacterized SAM-dependent methyltransferase